MKHEETEHEETVLGSFLQVTHVSHACCFLLPVGEVSGGWGHAGIPSLA
jgi:hypothetical protein